jgi:hypothetical protein
MWHVGRVIGSEQVLLFKRIVFRITCVYICVCTNASDQRKRAHNIEKKLNDIEQLIQVSMDDANIKLKRKITKQTVDKEVMV